jgi:hypothetical protein
MKDSKEKGDFFKRKDQGGSIIIYKRTVPGQKIHGFTFDWRVNILNSSLYEELFEID